MDPRGYQDFRLEIEAHPDGSVAIDVSSPEGETRRPITVPLSALDRSRISETVRSLRAKQLPAQSIMTLGTELAKICLPDQARQILYRALATASRTRGGVRIRLITDDAELASWPWEFLYLHHPGDATQHRFLALDETVSIVRHERQTSPVPAVRPLRGGRLRTLVVPAIRVPGAEAAADNHVQTIRHLMEATPGGADVAITYLSEAPTEAEVRTALATETYDLLLFVGHGVASSGEGDPGGLVLAGEDGPSTLSAHDMGAMLRDGDVRIAVFMACNSAERRPGLPWNGVAAHLVRDGIPAVIAMQHAVEASHALSFEAALLTNLAAAVTLDEAVSLGRRQVAQQGFMSEWGVPVIYTRSDGVLFSPGGRSHHGPNGAGAPIGAPVEPLNLETGLRLEAIGEWRKATNHYRQLLQGVTGADEARLQTRLGSALWHDGEFDEADDALGRARRLATELGNDGILAEVLLELGQKFEEQDELRKAERFYREAVPLLVDQPGARTRAEMHLASVERRAGSLNAALERLRSIDPHSLEPSLLAEYEDSLGSVLLARGQYGEAIVHLESAVRLDEEVHTDYRASRSRLLLAEAYLSRGQRREALSEVEEAARAYENAHDEEGQSEAWVLRGLIHEDAGEYEKAIWAYRQASNFDVRAHDIGGEARANRLLASASRKRGDTDAAQDYIQRSRDLLRSAGDDDIERAAMLTEDAMLDIEIAEYDRAINKLREALDIAEADDDDRAVALAKKNLAFALSEDGSSERAIKLLEEAAVVFRERGDLRALESLLDDLGEAYLDLGRFSEAEDVLHQSAELDEQLDSVQGQLRTSLLLGRVYLKIGKREECESQLRHALSLCESVDRVGESETRYWLGVLATENGQLNDATKQLIRALRIDRAMVDRMGIIRCHCALATAYRRGGDLARAGDHLDDAENELKTIDDPMEKNNLLLERAQFLLAKGEDRSALDAAARASAGFADLGNAVLAASAQRIKANAHASLHELAEAKATLTDIVAVFTEANAMTELSETYDDLASAHLLLNDMEQARIAIDASMNLDERSGWSSSYGRSLLLLAEVELRDSRFHEAKAVYEQALEAFGEARDVIGMANVELRLGNWYLDGRTDGQADASLRKANSYFREARRRFQAHQDLLGMGICYRKLGEVYAAGREFERAAEMLEQAEECLSTVNDNQEKAALAVATGSVLVAMNRHKDSIEQFEKALAWYRRANRQDKLNDVLRKLAAAYHNVGEIERSLDCIRQIGREQTRIWGMLLSNLHDDISSVSLAQYNNEEYGRAVALAADVVRKWLRKAEALENPTSSGVEHATVVFARSAVDLLGQLTDGDGWNPSGLDAVAAISVAHLVGTLMEPVLEKA